jgi:hypothetical protein
MKTMQEFLAQLRRVNLLMVLAMLLIGVANILWAERLMINGGLGWDGQTYGSLVKDYYQAVFVHGVPDYYARRVFPSAVVHYGMRLFSLPFTNANIIRSFDYYNLILLLISTYVWGRIADELKIQSRGKWFGFCFLFLNYAILKNNFYHSVLTDTTAFALGILMFYFFLIDSKAGMIAVILVGAFTWPSFPYMAALLFVFPFKAEPPRLSSLNKTSFFRANVVLAALVSGGTLVVLVYLSTWHLREVIAQFPQMLRVDTSLLCLSIIGVVAFLFLSFKTLLAGRTALFSRQIFKSISWQRTVFLILILIAVKVAQLRISSGQDIGWGGFRALFMHTFLVTLTEPLIFLVAHVVYYGPVILLLIFFWRPFCESLGEYGFGIQAFVILNVLMSINPQSRYQINSVTVFIIILVKLLDRAVLKEQNLLFWVALSLFYSKVWYVFNTAPQVDDGTMAILLRFPLQHYFMGSGPWMSKQMYYVQGGIVALTTVLLYFVVYKKSSRFGENTPAETR